MKFEKFEKIIFQYDIYIFPTIRLFINDYIYDVPNFAIEFHWMVLHCRWLFFRGDNIELRKKA